MKELLPMLSVALSVVALAAYELQQLWAAHRDPVTTARSAHRMLRGEWVRALSRQPGTEILAVQALRNSLMSATIIASTAVLLLMGAVSLMVSSGATSPLNVRQLSLQGLLELALVLALFATYVCSAMGMRYYHHAGFILSLPIGSAERTCREPLASCYVQRAGVLYSWSLRCFLFCAPIAIGLLDPLAMPFAAFGLVAALAFFDRVPALGN